MQRRKQQFTIWKRMMRMVDGAAKDPPILASKGGCGNPKDPSSSSSGSTMKLPKKLCLSINMEFIMYASPCSGRGYGCGVGSNGGGGARNSPNRRAASPSRGYDYGTTGMSGNVGGTYHRGRGTDAPPTYSSSTNAPQPPTSPNKQVSTPSVPEAVPGL